MISALPGQRAFPTDLPARPAGPENLLARYAAAEVAPGAERGRAMRLIVWGSTIGSVAGPNLMGPALGVGARLGVPPAASAFLVSVAGY